MNKRILKAIIANLLDQIEDTDGEPNLTPPQLEVAEAVREETSDAGDWQFDDTSPDYNLHVIRQFIHRKCDQMGIRRDGELVLRELTGEGLEAFIAEIHGLVK